MRELLAKTTFSVGNITKQTKEAFKNVKSKKRKTATQAYF